MKNEQPVYLMVPRKMVITFATVTLVLFLLLGANVWFTLYTAQRWCGIITLFDDSYKAAPPQTDTGRLVARAMSQIRDDYRC